jgi:penicillin-binding protein 1A
VKYYFCRTFLKIFFVLIFNTAILVGAIFVGTFFWLNHSIPTLDELNVPVRTPSVVVQASDGTILATYGDLYEEYIPVQDLPPYVKNAFLAVEDRRFYQHQGVDFKGLARAIITNVQASRVVQGGSTLTQQLAKNLLASNGICSIHDRSIKRKMQEFLLTLKLESRFSKDQILSLYINRVSFGAGVFGIDAASRKYFSKSAKELTLFEATILAGVLRGPSRYSPVAHPQRAVNRACVVLKAMESAGFLDASWQELLPNWKAEFLKNPIAFEKGSKYFADWIYETLPSIIGPIDQDLIVTTTLNPLIQKTAEEVCQKFYKEFSQEYKFQQVAGLLTSSDGTILAMIGGIDYGQSQFNRAVYAMRQLGSAFKPFVFLAAIEDGVDIDSKIEDSPYQHGSWKPGNYKWKSLGEISVLEAFTYSVNSVCLRLAEMVGLRKVLKVAKRLGIHSAIRYNLASALGASEGTMLEYLRAYSPFASYGYASWPYGVFEVRDKDGNILYQHSDEVSVRVIDEKALTAMKAMMQAVVRRGTGRAANVDSGLFGKTGTNNSSDAWVFLCRDPVPDSDFSNVDEDSPRYVIDMHGVVFCVWIGNDSMQDKMAPLSTGGRIPARIAAEIMKRLLGMSKIENVVAKRQVSDTNVKDGTATAKLMETKGSSAAGGGASAAAARGGASAAAAGSGEKGNVDGAALSQPNKAGNLVVEDAAPGQSEGAANEDAAPTIPPDMPSSLNAFFGIPEPDEPASDTDENDIPVIENEEQDEEAEEH